MDNAGHPIKVLNHTLMAGVANLHSALSKRSADAFNFIAHRVKFSVAMCVGGREIGGAKRRNARVF